MNAQDRKILSQVYNCLNRMTGLSPSNPADMDGISKFANLTTSVIPDMMYILSDLQFGDYESAQENADDMNLKLGITDKGCLTKTRQSVLSDARPHRQVF